MEANPKIVMMALDKIKPYEKNPRYNDNAVESVAESIKEFGFKVPIVIDKNFIIITGHTRYKASKMLGLKEVPVIIAEDLSDAKAKAFRIADNKTAEKSNWDYDKLYEELNLIDDVEDLLKYGFTRDELDIQPAVDDLIDTEYYIEDDIFDKESGRLIITYANTLEESWLKQKLNEKGILKDVYKVSNIVKKGEEDLDE